MIFSKENDKMLMNLALKNNLDMDKVLSAYLITGDLFFMLLHVFEGQDLHVPSKRRLNAANLHNIEFLEDDKREYKDYEKYDSIEKDGKFYTVISEERKILNHWYLPIILSEVIKDE